MALTDPDQAGAALAVLVAEPETVPTASLAFPPREAGPPALAAAVIGLGVGEKRPTEINRGLLTIEAVEEPAEPGAGDATPEFPA